MSKTNLEKRQKKFLTSERVARLATINTLDKSPHLVPVCFAFDGKTIVTTLHVKSKRLKNVKQRSKVAILVDRYEEDKGGWKVLRGLLIYGKTRILIFYENKEEFMYGWKLLIQKYPQYRQWANSDFTPKDPDKRRIMEIEPTKTICWGFD
jgi:nitroimidazol reductase NimA-like FMN-containing flavoprotein (pyridoxamine 5'-phosphate oxidase superfamily)